MTLCRELMNNLDGITSALVALQLLPLCLLLSLMLYGIIDLGHHAWLMVLDKGPICINCFIVIKLLPQLCCIDLL